MFSKCQRPSVTYIKPQAKCAISYCPLDSWGRLCNGNSLFGKCSAGCKHYHQASTGMEHATRTNVLPPSFQLVIVYYLSVLFVTDLIYMDNLQRATSSCARKLLVCYVVSF
jgi:hypothetical protein